MGNSSLKLPVRTLNVLVVDDERELRESLSQILTHMGHNVLVAEKGEEALSIIRERGIDTPTSIHMVLLDVLMPGVSGLEVLRQIRQRDPSITVLIITAHGNIRDAVEAMRVGAYNYIEKPIQQRDLEDLVRNASEAHNLVEETSLSSPKVTLENGEEFIGKSHQMRAVFQVIQKLGSVNTSVLIRGENGTGKELVARAIHFNSPRKDKPFVGINCAAISENLIESEFFGHEKGAFTGAEHRHIGKFQYAEGGTLFLDEIGDISPSLQVKLLRVLQERKFTPIGSNREIKCDVRIIAATNRNLEEMIRNHEFRQDLFYRLNVMPIQLPPLRDRTEDIPNLVAHFIDKFNALHLRKGTSREIRGIREDALNALRNYLWPGNIRELENIIERSFVLETTYYLTLPSLPEFLSPKSERAHLSSNPEGSKTIAIDFHMQKEQFERDFIVHALKRFKGRINQTATHAGIPKNTLLRKIRKYSIDPGDYGPVDQFGEERQT
jgi:two-component system, NtrC family, response regulator AtoC